MSLTKLQESKLRALPGFDDLHARALCSEPLPYAEAQKIVQKAGIKTITEFKAWKRPEGVPSTPDMTYKDKGWKSWPEFLGTGVPFVALSYKEAQKIVQKAGIQNAREFYARKPKPEGVPSQPYVIYKGKGWKNWPEFFGTGTTDYVSYEKAQKIVRKAGIKTATEFWAWKLKPEGMPSTPYVIYKDKGWESWQEFFGTGVPFVALPYRDSQKLVQKAGIKTVTEFYAWKPKPFGVPSTPDRDYKGRGWKNWPEFFGKKDYRKRRES